VKFGLDPRHNSSLSRPHRYQSFAFDVRSGEGALFFPNLVQLGRTPLKSGVWKSAPFEKMLNRQ